MKEGGEAEGCEGYMVALPHHVLTTTEGVYLYVMRAGSEPFQHMTERCGGRVGKLGCCVTALARPL